MSDIRRPDGDPLVKWDISRDILSTRSFPATSILRELPSLRNNKGRSNCSCTDGQVHRTFFDVCRSVIAPSMKNDLAIPEVQVCWNAENLFECKLNKEYTGLKTRHYFRQLKTVGVAQKVLFNGTYWFKRLIKRDSSGNLGRSGVALLRLLAGMDTYAGKHRVDQLCKMPISKGSVNKLRNILATVDGLLMQLVLCFPDRKDYLSWERLDQIVHCLISTLLSDYFNRRSEDLSSLTTFEKLKKLRKAIKERGFSPIGDLSTIDIPREMSFMTTCLSFVSMRKRPIDMYRIATLCQTRASGVPPKVVYTKTLSKIKAILVEKPDPSVYEENAGLIQLGVDEIHTNVLEKLGGELQKEKFWRACLDKAKISLSDSGEFFTNSESGGKLEAARKVLRGNPIITKRSLETGEVVGRLQTSTDCPGECLFYWAFDQFHDRNRCYERNLMSVRISLVAELGKYRGITVSPLAHAVLLHVLSHVLLEYLRVIPSSETGVGASNHAWMFFKRLSHKNPHANFLFGDKEVYLFSTDWEQATDYCDHTVAAAMLNRLCYQLGIPNYYRETCIFALSAPRQVEFIDPEGKTLECFFTERGELMGDPVTKVILHLYHLVGRVAAREQIFHDLHSGRNAF